MSPDTSHAILSTKSSLSSGSSGSSNKDNDLNGLDRIVCKDTTNDDGMTGSGGEMEEDEDEDLEDGETPMNLSPALDHKMMTEVSDNNTTAINNHHNQQHLNNTQQNGNSGNQVEAINLCKNNDSIIVSRTLSTSLSSPIRTNTTSSIGLSAKMRLKKQRLAMEAAAAAAAAASESDNKNQSQQVRTTSPSAVSNSVYQQATSSLSPKSKHGDDSAQPQAMDIVMNLSSRNANASTEGRPIPSRANHRTSIYTRWANNHQTSNGPIDVDSSALHRLAEAAEWKQVRIYIDHCNIPNFNKKKDIYIAFYVYIRTN
jgi:hypothetical protein